MAGSDQGQADAGPAILPTRPPLAIPSLTVGALGRTPQPSLSQGHTEDPAKHSLVFPALGSCDSKGLQGLLGWGVSQATATGPCLSSWGTPLPAGPTTGFQEEKQSDVSSSCRRTFRSHDGPPYARPGERADSRREPSAQTYLARHRNQEVALTRTPAHPRGSCLPAGGPGGDSDGDSDGTSTAGC